MTREDWEEGSEEDVGSGWEAKRRRSGGDEDEDDACACSARAAVAEEALARAAVRAAQRSSIVLGCRFGGGIDRPTARVERKEGERLVSEVVSAFERRLSRGRGAGLRG
jgi:hypothetical protein